MSGPLHARVREVLCQAIAEYPDERRLRDQLARMDGPLRVAIAGKAKAGKSTLLNALVGEEIAPTDAGECTKVVTWYRFGQQPRIVVHPVAGPPADLRVERRRGALHIDMGGLRPDAVDRIVVDWPSSLLRDTTLVDTPGVASASEDVHEHATRFLLPTDGPGDVDAVVYLMRQLHGTDIGMLDAFRENPLHTIAVLSRADEIGVGRVDALMSARRVADRYRARLRALCGAVVPVAGLLAQAARTMRQEEFAALASLAAVPKDVLDAAMLSVDRFTDPRAEDVLHVSARRRAALLARFGPFGIRLAVVLLRQGVSQPDVLAAELVRRSGVGELQGVLATQFAQRRDLLKARAALTVLADVVRRRPGGRLRRIVEQLSVSAHELVEMRVLGRLRGGEVRLAADAVAEAERLLGGQGWQAWARLGLGPTASRAQHQAAVMGALRRWQVLAEHPLTDRASVELARVVIRTCEGLAVAE
jgi:GTP-binding protein EngB required for normal cell division